MLLASLGASSKQQDIFRLFQKTGFDFGNIRVHFKWDWEYWNILILINKFSNIYFCLSLQRTLGGISDPLK